MSDKHLAVIKGYINKMPSLSTTVTKIMEICNDPTASPADLNKVISLDPVLMGKVMKLINSAYYGLSQEITSLVRAIIMLGLNTVKNLALSTAVLGNLGDKSVFQALNMEGFWRHSLCVGVAAKGIAKKLEVDKNHIEEYFIAGLLHDIGKIPMNNKLSEEYIQAMSYSDRGQIPLDQAEMEVIGFDHAKVGALIMENWRLGEEITDVVTHHHTPQSYEGKNTAILYAVMAADYFANAFEIGFSGNRYPQKPEDDVFRSVQVSMEYFEEIEDEIQGEIDKAAVFLKLSQ